MREQDLFVLADRTLQSVVEQISDDRWQMALPAEFQRSGEGPATLRTIIGYHAYDDAWVPDMVTGATMEETGKDKFDGDLLGADPKLAFTEIVDQACAAVQALADGELDRIVHCSFGDFSAREYLWQIITFRGLRAHDIAQVIGVSTVLPADLVTGLWQLLEAHADEWRTYGVFGPRVEVPDDASLQDKLLGLTGRQPDAPG